jgi:hypothetical protein
MTTIGNSLECRCHNSRPTAPGSASYPASRLTVEIMQPPHFVAALLEEDHGYHQSWLGKAPVLDLTGFKNGESGLKRILNEWGECRYVLDTHTVQVGLVPHSGSCPTLTKTTRPSYLFQHMITQQAWHRLMRQLQI